MRKFISFIAATTLVTSAIAVAQNEPLAVMVPGGGTYSRSITTDSAQAQAFFDQGLRMAWSFYFQSPLRLIKKRLG